MSVVERLEQLLPATVEAIRRGAGSPSVFRVVVSYPEPLNVADVACRLRTAEPVRGPLSSEPAQLASVFARDAAEALEAFDRLRAEFPGCRVAVVRAGGVR